jgi:hypothetical protein
VATITPVSQPDPADACRRRLRCALCGDDRLRPILSLAPTPPGNAFVRTAATQRLYPLDLAVCEGCGHGQLLDIVDRLQVIGRATDALGDRPDILSQAKANARSLLERFGPPTGGLVVEIGSNDGSFLKVFDDAGRRVQGIEPAVNVAGQAIANGVRTFPGLFSAPVADRILDERGRAILISAQQLFAQTEDPAEILDGVRILLAPDGVFVFEVTYFSDVVEGGLFDSIHHLNLHYFAVTPLRRFFDKNGFELFAVERTAARGGSLRGSVQLPGGPFTADGSVETLVAFETRIGLTDPVRLAPFPARVEMLCAEVRGRLEEIKGSGGRIAGYGSEANTTTLLHQLGLDGGTLDFLIDDNADRQGLLSPGLHVPVLSPEALLERRPDWLLISAWNHAEEVMARHEAFQRAGGHFLVPLPSLVII